MLIKLVVPSEILTHFEVSEIQDFTDRTEITLTEKENLIPAALRDKSAVLNGYWNAIELQTFPQQGKACYLKLRRRKWKEAGGGESYGNNYHYNIDGTKATRDFGAFLKEKIRYPTAKL